MKRPVGPFRSNTLIGRAGETRAATFLRNHDYEILERNFRTSRGEVDIIAVDRDTLVFCEVKTWRVVPVEDLQYSINRTKVHRIVAASLQYLHDHPQFSERSIRYDVIHIAGTPETGDLRHLKNAIEKG